MANNFSTMRLVGNDTVACCMPCWLGMSERCFLPPGGINWARLSSACDAANCHWSKTLLGPLFPVLLAASVGPAFAPHYIP